MFEFIEWTIVLCAWSLATTSLGVCALPELPKACDECESESYIHEFESVYVSRCVNATSSEVVSDESEYNLCSTQLKHQMVDPRSGLVAFCILLPHDTANSRVLLRALKPGDEKNVTQDCTPRQASVHSSFRMIQDNKHDPACRPDQFKEIKWKFNYLFTGWYVVEIELKFNCSSPPFYAESNFTKEPLARENLSVTRKFVGDTAHITIKGNNLKNDCDNNLQTTSCVEIGLYRETCSHVNSTQLCRLRVFSNRSRILETGNVNSVMPWINFLVLLASAYLFGFLTRHCYWFKEEPILSLQCSCIWANDYLECLFSEIPPGLYCLELEIYDSRCKRGTLWTENSTTAEPCLWKLDNLAVKNNSASRGPYQDVTSSPQLSWIVLLFIGASVVGVSLSLYLRLRNRNKFLPVASRPTDTAVSIALNPSDKVDKNRKVFLLYARDNDPFMKAMAELGNLLRQSTGAQVVDLWDRGTKERIDTTGDTWALRYLLDEDVQAVVVASPGSVRIEQAILNDEPVTYDVPDSRDDTFTSAFKTVIRMAHNQKDRCWKIIVVRINTKGCSNVVLKSFEETLATVYTLPQHIDNLLSHIRHDPPSASSLQSKAAFQRTIEDFQTYLVSNKDVYSDVQIC